MNTAQIETLRSLIQEEARWVIMNERGDASSIKQQNDQDWGAFAQSFETNVP
jgi:hypothetical protein